MSARSLIAWREVRRCPSMGRRRTTRSRCPSVARRMIAMIDLTDLADDRSAAGIDDLCARAALNGTAAVCVWPEHVARCVAQLHGTRIQIATVVNFPTGDEPLDVVVAQTSGALDEGADEIDVVIPYRSLLVHDTDHVVALLDAVRDATGDRAAQGDPRDGRALRPRHRPRSDAPGDRPRCRLRQDVDRQDARQRDRSRGAGDARRDPHRWPVVDPSGSSRREAFARSRTLVGHLSAADDVMGQGWATPSTFRFGASGLLDALLLEIGG